MTSFPFLPDHNHLIEERYRKAEALRQAGITPYPATAEAADTAADVLARAGALMEFHERVSLLGRVMTIRSFGKAAFFHLRDRSGQIQVYIKKNVVSGEGFRLYKEFLDSGDLVRVEGKVFRTKTDEITVEAAELQIAAKAVRQLPEKWHGFRQVEARYRQRYVDLIANPEVADAFRTRSRAISAMRRFLDEEDFMEVETPMMQAIYGGAAARPFVTHHNTLDMRLYLRIAPELFLKRLVVGGLDRVYEINRNFRNEGISTQHNPEFTMLELYAGGWNADRMMDFVEAILRETAMGALGTAKAVFGEAEMDFAAPIPRLRMVEAVSDALGTQVDWDTPIERISELAGGLPEEVRTREEAIVHVFESRCEEKLQQPTFIYEFPKSLSPLAKSVEGKPEVADRFELYIAGMEIANGYSELNDPREQYERFAEQAERRKAGDEEAPGEVDEDYVRALEYGMVPAAGLGIGIDRLAMVLTNSPSIRDVILFPLLRPAKREEHSDGPSSLEDAGTGEGGG